MSAFKYSTISVLPTEVVIVTKIYYLRIKYPLISNKIVEVLLLLLLLLVLRSANAIYTDTATATANMPSHSNQEQIRSSSSVALLVIVYTVYANEFVCVHFSYCHNTISHCIIHQQNNSSCDNAFLHNYILISV